MSINIQVKNFQSIRDAKVTVDRFTVITGPNNSGKTAFIRATRGVFQNTRGTAFIREGEQKCSVEVDFGTDGKVCWEKGTGKRDRPTYTINDGQPLHPGASVPDEVAEFGIVPVQAGGQEVWPSIAEQFTGQIFLLDRPGSALAEAVADVVRVGQLNGALRASERDRRQVHSTLKVRRSDLVQQENEVHRYDGLDEAVADVVALESARVQVVALAKAIVGISGLRQRLDQARGEALRLSPIADITLPKEKKAREILDQVDVLRALERRYSASKAEVARYQGVGSILVSVQAGPSQRLLKARDVLLDFQSRLLVAEASVVARQEQLDVAMSNLLKRTEEAAALLAAMGVCPVCKAVTGGGR